MKRLVSLPPWHQPLLPRRSPSRRPPRHKNIMWCRMLRRRSARSSTRSRPRPRWFKSDRWPSSPAQKPKWHEDHQGLRDEVVSSGSISGELTMGSPFFLTSSTYSMPSRGLLAITRTSRFCLSVACSDNPLRSIPARVAKDTSKKTRLAVPMGPSRFKTFHHSARHLVHISPSKMSCFVDDTYEMGPI